MVDPEVEKTYSCSPYTYCLNSPIKNIDPDGRQVIPVPLPVPVPVPIYYTPYKPIYNYPTSRDVAKGVNNVVQGMKTNTLFFVGASFMFYEQTKQALRPEYKHQRDRDRRNKEGLDQNQANVAESIKNNITATTPSGDPMPKRGPEDGSRKTKIAISVATIGASVRAGLELTNPNPSKDAVEAHTEKVQQPAEKQTNIWEIIKNLFQN